MKRFNKIITSVVLTCFVFNAVVQDHALALDPGKVSTGGLRPVESAETVRSDMYAAAEKVKDAGGAEDRIGFTAYIKEHAREAAGASVDWKFVAADYAAAPDTLGPDSIYGETSLLKAADMVSNRLMGAKTALRITRPDAARAELCAWVESGAVVLNSEFVRKWDILRQNDIWFEYKAGGAAHTESVAWAVFFSVFKPSAADHARGLSCILREPEKQRFAMAFLDAALAHKAPGADRESVKPGTSSMTVEDARADRPAARKSAPAAAVPQRKLAVEPTQKRALITGGAGYVGSVLTRYLMDRGVDVWVIDDESTGHAQAVPEDLKKAGRYIKGDVTNRELLQRIITDNDIDVVYHLAAKTLMGDSVEQPALYNFTNFGGTLAVAEAIKGAQQATGKRVVLLNASTCGVYDEDAAELKAGRGLTEKSAVKPTAPYQGTKLLAERLLEQYALEHGVEYVTIRPFNIVGAYRASDGQIYGEDTGHPSHLITRAANFVRGLQPDFAINGNDFDTAQFPGSAKLDAARLGLYGAAKDGTTIREYIHVVDICRIAFEFVNYTKRNLNGDTPVAERIVGGGTGIPQSTLKVTDEVLRQAIELGLIAELPEVPFVLPRDGDDAAKTLDSELQARMLGIRPESLLSLSEIIRSHLEFNIARPRGYEDDKSGFKDLGETESLRELLKMLDAAPGLAESIKKEVLYTLMTDLVVSAIGCGIGADRALLAQRKEQRKAMQRTRGNLIRDKGFDAAINDTAMLDAFGASVAMADNAGALDLAVTLARKLGLADYEKILQDRIAPAVSASATASGRKPDRSMTVRELFAPIYAEPTPRERHLKTRTINTLARKGCDTVGKILDAAKSGWLRPGKARGLGAEGMQLIRDAFRYRGWELPAYAAPSRKSATGAALAAGRGAVAKARVLEIANVNVAGSVLPVVKREEIDPDKVRPQEVVVPDAGGIQEAAGIADEALRQGKVAVITVAGGMSSRAGIEYPKGMHPIAPLSEKTLFAKRAEEIRAFGILYGKPVLWYLMTSDVTDEPTRRYFGENGYFGLGKENVVFIRQASVPAFEAGTADPAMKDAGNPLTAPNGHGGLYKAMQDASARTDGAAVSGIRTAIERGVTTFLFSNVDNPMPVIDLTVIGHHLMKDSDFTSVMLRKRDAGEGLAMAVESLDGADRFFVEYNQPVAKILAGRPGYEYGSINRLVFSRDFLASTGQPPYRVAPGKEAAIFKNGTAQKGLVDKFESFAFEAQGLARKTLNIAGRRDESFAAFKKMEGPDSPESVARAMSELDKKRVRSSVPGAEISDESTVELSYAFAKSAGDITSKVSGGLKVKGASKVYLGGRNIIIGRDVVIDNSSLTVEFEDPYTGVFAIPRNTVIGPNGDVKIFVRAGEHVEYGGREKPGTSSMGAEDDPAGPAGFNPIPEQGLQAMRKNGQAPVRSLPDVITEYIQSAVAEKGEAGVPQLAREDKENVYRAVTLMEETKIEIILPQRVRAGGVVAERLKLTDSVLKTLGDIKARSGRGALSWKEYSDEEDLANILRTGDPRVKRIVIAEEELAPAVRRLFEARADLFSDVRLYNMKMPSGYASMGSTEKSVIQARALTIAILMRLYEKDKYYVRALLEDLLRDRLSEGADIKEYIDAIVEQDTVKRLQYFISTVVSLVETLGKQLRILEKFVWSAA